MRKPLFIKRLTQMLAVGLLVAFMAPPVLAWNESGHRIIAAAAARQMSPALQGVVVAALKAHPRYDKDLDRYRPRNLGGLSEAEWLMGQAAQWPDRIRRFNNEPFYRRKALVEQYHRGRWHYINLPLYLGRADESLNIADPTATINSENPDNVLAALEFIRMQLGSSEVALSQKGLWISWALHLIADVHQPLHTTAMFEHERWPKGDRGGNDVKINGSGKKGKLDSLHYYWDSAISNVRKPRDIHRLVGVLEQQTLPEPLGNETDPVLWIRQGNQLAKRVVYGPLLAQVRESSLVTITGEYTQQAHATGLQAGALAARRTAQWLQAALAVELADSAD